MMVSPDFLTQFEAERDALRATNRQLAEANATLRPAIHRSRSVVRHSVKRCPKHIPVCND